MTRYGGEGSVIPELPKIKPIDRGSVVTVSHKLGTPLMPCPEWLKAMKKEDIPEPERLAFTPPRRGEGKFAFLLLISFSSLHPSSPLSSFNVTLQ